MESILLLAAVVIVALLRGQHVRIKALERDLANFRTELAAGGREAALPPQAGEPAPDSNDPDGQEPDAVEPEGEHVAPGPWHQAAARRAEANERSAEPSSPAPAARPDIETALGTRWAVWVGGLALALGGVFLVRYSIEAGIFGPRVRLAAASLFGLLLAAAGEFTRRKGFAVPGAGIRGAYVPSILTAAAAATLFGAAYAAHGIYGFIGPAAAFALLGTLALATVAIALAHGQALAGLGLLGSYATPLLSHLPRPIPGRCSSIFRLWRPLP